MPPTHTPPTPYLHHALRQLPPNWMVRLLRRVVATTTVCCSLVSLTTSIVHTPSSARAPWRARPATIGKRTRSALNMVVDERSTTSRGGGSASVPGGVSAMSAQMKEMRADMEKDEKTALMMQVRSSVIFRPPRRSFARPHPPTRVCRCGPTPPPPALRARGRGRASPPHA